MEQTFTPTGPSDRVRVAQIARETALSLPEVADLDSGLAGSFCTAGGGVHVSGVTSAVAPEGGYDVALRLVCELVELRPLADRVRRAIVSEAAQAGVLVLTVTLDIVQIVDPSAA